MADWIVDLSWPIRAGLGDVPGHPATVVEEFHWHATHGRSNALLTMSIHSSTHLDVPYHFYPDGQTVDRLAVDRLCSPGALVDLKGRVANGQPVARDLLERELEALGIKDLAGTSVLMRTGWEERYAGEGYYLDNPHLSTEAAEWLACRRVNLVGLDFPPDAIGRKMVVPAPAPVHETLLGAGVCILENLANLGNIPEPRFELLCLPIKLEGHGGGPARVLVRGLPSANAERRS